MTVIGDFAARGGTSGTVTAAYEASGRNRRAPM